VPSLASLLDGGLRLALGEERSVSGVAAAGMPPVSMGPPVPPMSNRPMEWRRGDGSLWASCRVVGGRAEILVPGTAHFQAEESGIRATVFAPEQEGTAVDLYRRFVLPMMLQAHGAEALHASAVVGPQGVVAFCGEAGVGKSTLAYLLGRRGLAPWADDTVVFTGEAGRFRVHPLPFAFRLDPAVHARWGAGSAETVRAATAPLEAVAILERRAAAEGEDGAGPDPDLMIRRLAPAEAFRAVMPHGCAFWLGDQERNRRMIETYLDLVSGVAIYRVRFRPDLAAAESLAERIAVALLSDGASDAGAAGG
jgi:hypothetical protein